MSRIHICDVPGCNRKRARWQRICEPCYLALPGDIRSEIIDAWRQARRSDWRRACKRAAEHFARIAARRAGRTDADVLHPTPRLTPEQVFTLNQRLLGER